VWIIWHGQAKAASYLRERDKLSSLFGIGQLAPKGLHGRLLLAFVGISLIPLLIVSATFFFVLVRNVEGENFAKLQFVIEAKRSEIRQYLQFASRQADSLSQTNIVRYSIGEFYGFSYGFREVSSEPEEAARILRAAFGIGQGAAPADRDQLIRSALIYDNMHSQFHGEYEAFLASSEYDNLYLINNEGRIVYSVEKDNYLATSIFGTVSNSTIARLASSLLGKRDGPSFAFGDYELDPITGEFAAYVAVKVDFYSRPSGVVVFRLPTDGINQIVQSEGSEAGQIFLLSSRELLLSQPQNGPYEIGERRTNIDEVINGHGTGKVRLGLSGHEALAAFGSVDVFDKTWRLISEVPAHQAYSSADTLIRTVSTLALLAIPILFIIAMRLARSATLPILRVTDTAEAIAAGDLNRSMPRIEKPIELKRLTDSFGRMRDAVREQLSQINSNVAAIEEKNAQLEEADRMKDTFLANTSHELRTPLNGIVGISETLSAGAAGELTERQRSQLQLITFSARKLSRLVDDLLDLYRIRQGRMRLDMHPVDLATSVRNVLQLSEPLMRGEPVTLRVDIDKDIPYVMADPVRLEQILHNLVGNAIKYTEAGSIHIFAKAENGWVSISIIDTGVGISQEDLGRMFQPLEQADGVDTARKTGGTGLGLTIARQLATILGGSLFATSTLGEGSNFTLRLKAATEEELAKDGVYALNAPQSGYHETLNDTEEQFQQFETIQREGAPDILIVDDEPINLQVLRNVLLPQGYAVRSAENGRTALKMIETRTPDLIILDVMMPDMSGLEVARHVRDRHDHLELPIIMVTARSRTRDIIAGLEAGANDYVVKPFVKDELLARLGTLLEASKARKATTENAQLHAEMNRRIQVEDALRLSQNRMANLLDALNVALLCSDVSGRVTYANIFAEKWLSVRGDGQTKMQDLVGQKLFADILAACDEAGEFEPVNIELKSIDEPIQLYGFELEQEAGGGVGIFLRKPGNESTSSLDVNMLRQAVDVIDVPSISNAEIEESQQDASTPQRGVYREKTVELVKKAMDLWLECKGKTKFDFAEQSRIWRVHLDRSSLQTRTLDKYFSVETLTKNTRWRDVIATGEFVLKSCANEAEKDKLDEIRVLKSEIAELIKQGAAKWGE
jgi:two-component system sensor histidine kinase ChiS